MNILIVDDNQTNRKLLSVTLGAEGYSTVEAGDGIEALGVLEREAVDAVISDVLMPNMDGYRLCSEVRSCERYGTIPFIFYTSTYTDTSDEKLAIGFGADRFLRKPAAAKEITETIKQLLAQRGGSPSGPVLVEELNVMKQYSQTLIRKLEKRNDQLSAQTAALHSSETRLRTIFDAEPDSVQVAGRDGKVTEINPAGLKMFEADSLEQLADRSMAQFVTGNHLTAFEACVEAVWRGERSCVEFEMAGLQGTPRWLEMHAAPLRDPQGELVALLGITRDNTARKELEEQFVQAQKMEVVGQLASGVAHDFNNMIGIIMGYSEIMINESSSGSSMHKSLVTIFHTAQRAAALTRQLLIFSRKETPQPKLLDLGEVISGLDSMLRRIIGENITLVTEPEVDLGRVEADPGQIEQVLMNLTVNARDAMPNGGTIRVATSNATLTAEDVLGTQMEPGDYVVLSVADDGCGITEEVKAKMFEAFFTTKPAGMGTGLGLATCRSIAHRWGGYITVNSVFGIGAMFKVYLPRATHSVGAVAVSIPPGALPRGTETILIVEDELGLRELAASVLQKQGYSVLKAANGQEALRVVRERRGLPIDLALTDMVMPEMGGKIMAEWLQATNPEIRILFTSGYTECGLDGELDEGIEFLPKPYTPSALVRKTREVIDRAGNEAALAK
jgi:two-component system cell cycle sensor histidine kinase/response regulator CckA